jgi:hypothetical protein
LIEEAIEIAGATAGLTLLPEISSLKGRLLLLLAEADETGAERSYQRAFEGAGEIDARMMQLRAAIGLCTPQLKRDGAQDQLRAVYATFTEGFTTPDLIQAQEVLEHPSEWE